MNPITQGILIQRGFFLTLFFSDSIWLLAMEQRYKGRANGELDGKSNSKLEVTYMDFKIVLIPFLAKLYCQLYRSTIVTKITTFEAQNVRSETLIQLRRKIILTQLFYLDKTRSTGMTADVMFFRWA
jgi:hypothetical protein